MALGIVEAGRNNMLDEISALVNGGPSGGLIRIYDGARPATGGAVTTLLAELTFSDPAFPAAASGTMSANAITDDSSADATGTATWFRVVDSTGAFVYDGDVGTSGSDLNLNTTSITIGVNVAISTLTITMGNA